MPVNVGQVPGTTIVVDGFRPPHKVENTFFLSHFHADHYTGIKGTTWNAGPIYCSEITARLLELELEVDPKWIVPLSFDDEHEIAGAKVVLVDANHCTWWCCKAFPSSFFS